MTRGMDVEATDVATFDAVAMAFSVGVGGGGFATETLTLPLCVLASAIPFGVFAMDAENVCAPSEAVHGADSISVAPAAILTCFDPRTLESTLNVNVPAIDEAVLL